MANVAHSGLTGSDLHEPKGVAAASANKVYVTNGAGSGTFTAISSFTGAFGSQYFHCQETQTSGTAGSSLTSSSWNTRAINGEVTDDLGLSIVSSQISLVAGTYFIMAEAVAAFTGTLNRNTNENVATKLRVRNITDGTTLLNGPGNRFNLVDDGGGNDQLLDMTLWATIRGRFTIAGTKTIELQNWVTTTLVTSPTIKSGRAISSGENEVYTDMIIVKTA